MALSVTVVTAAFGSGGSVRQWANAWTGAGARCVVTDNGGGLSGDMFPGVLLLPFTGNTGFGGGINRAVEAAGSDLVLITNPDTLPAGPGSLEELAAFHERNTLSGGQSVNDRGLEVPSSGVWPDLPWVRSQVLKPADTLWRRSRRDWLQGSLIMARKSDFLDLDGFDPGYPLYFEDADLCARAVKAGMSISYNEKATFVHNEGTGSSGSAAVRLAGFHWGMARFFQNHRREVFLTVRKLILLKCLIRAAILLPVSPGRASGYMKGFNAVFRGIPPELPERANG